MTGHRLSRRELATLALRATLEIGIVAALAAWGAQTGDGTGMALMLAFAAPMAGFGFWGAVDFRGAGRAAEPLRLTQELVVSALAAGALLGAGHQSLAGALAGVSLLYHALVYAFGQRLLKPIAPRP